MRGLTVALCGCLLMIGCGGADKTSAPSMPDLPPGITPGREVDRGVAEIFEGSFTLNGATETDPGYVDSPHQVPIEPSRTGHLTLLQYRVTPVPGPSNQLYAVQYNYARQFLLGLQPRPNDGWNYNALYYGHPFNYTLDFYNQENPFTTLYNDAATWEYRAEIIQVEDLQEPNDDDNVATITDRSLATPLTLDVPSQFSLFNWELDAYSDLEDWHEIDLIANQEYSFAIENTNQQWGQFTYDLELYNTAGTKVESLDNLTETTGQFTYITPPAGAGTYHLRVTGTPSGAGSETINFVRYTLTASEEELREPELSGILPTDGITGQSVMFRAPNSGGPVETWSWDFGGGAIPNTSSAATPTVTLGAVGVYSGEVVATNAAGESRIDVDFEVHGEEGPLVLSVAPDEGFALRPTTFVGTLAGPTADEWEWDFGGGATPNTSTDESPLVNLGEPGSYDGLVTVRNAFGESSTPFSFDVKVRLLALDIAVITSGGNPPRLGWGMPSWDPADFPGWVDEMINPHFAPAGIAFDPAQVRVTFHERPELYNIDSGAEDDALMDDFVYGNSDPDQINLVLINDNNATGWAGVMSDKCPDRNNAERGCISTCSTEFHHIKTVCHELGHVLDLPHTGVGFPPTELNNNMMGYWTDDMSLSHDTQTEQPGLFCMIYPEEFFDQYQVAHDWVWDLSDLP